MGAIKEIGKQIIYKSPLLFQGYESLSYWRHRKQIEAQVRKGNLKLHLACGEQILPGWVNVDMRLNPIVLTMKFPQGLKRFPDNAVSRIYSSHFLEHLPYPEVALSFLRECCRILAPEGILRLVVPDMECIFKAYAHKDLDFFRIQARYHPASCTTRLEHIMYALQQAGEHQYGYDGETLEKLLHQAGFEHIERNGYNGSRLSDLRMDYRKETDPYGNNLSLFFDAYK